MQSENYTQLLDLAARLWRIDPEYWDIWGRKHITSDETKRAILKGLGVRAETAESLRASIDARRRPGERGRISRGRSGARPRHFDRDSRHDPVDCATGGHRSHQLRDANVQVQRGAGGVCRVFESLQFVPDEFILDRSL